MKRTLPRRRVGAVALALAGLLATAPLGAQRNVVDLRPTSEEQPPAICPRGYVVKGIRCSGSYCDNKTLRCAYYGPSAPRYEWSPWFSEEGTAEQTASGAFVAGIACDGGWCDNLRLRFVRDETLGDAGMCLWTRPFSEEQGYRECPADMYVAGVRCSGRYCDNLALRCCRPGARSQSRHPLRRGLGTRPRR